MKRLIGFLIAFFITDFGMSQKAELVIQSGHNSVISAVDISRDGRFVVTGSADKTVKLWDLQTGRLLRTFSGHTGEIYTVCISPDNRWVISAGGKQGYIGKDDHAIRIWNSATGECFKIIQENKGTADIKFSEDGKYFAYSTDHIHIYSAENFILKKKIKCASSGILEFSRDEEYLFFGGTQGDFKVISMKKTEPIIEQKINDGRMITAMYFNKKENSLFLTDESDLVEWDMTSKKVLSKKYNKGTGNNCRTDFHPDGNDYVGLKEKRIGIRDTEKFLTVYHVNGSPSSEILKLKERVYAGNDNIERYVFNRENNFSEWHGARYSRDGRYFITAHNQVAVLWDSQTKEEIRSFSGKADAVERAELIGSGERLASAFSNSVVIWNLKTGRIERRFSVKGVPAFSVHHDGERILIGDNDSLSRIYSLQTGKTLFQTKHNNYVGAVQFSPNGDFFITGSNDKDVTLWSTASLTPNHRFSIPESYGTNVKSVSFSPNGQLVLLNTRHDQLIFNTFQEHPLSAIKEGFVSYNSFSSGGHYYYICSELFSANIYEASTHKLIAKIKNNYPIWSLDITPDESAVIFGGQFKGIQYRSLKSEKISEYLPGHDNIVSYIKFIPKNRLLTTGYDGAIKLWDLAAKKEIAAFLSLGEEFAIVTPDYYYTSSLGAHTAIHFAEGLNYYRFDNFDLIFNRPDIVLRRIGVSDSAIIGAYQKAYLKRLKKMGFTQEQLSADIHLPVIEITDRALPVKTDKKKFIIPIKATDTKYKLNRINVYVNDVPWYGVKGFDIQKENTSEYNGKIEIELSTGKNIISVSTHNEKGVESLRRTVEILSSSEPVKPSLHIVAIGVSRFLQSQFDLAYAVKDAKDIAELFRNSRAFSQVQVTSFHDADATRSNILKSKENLLKTGVDDMVVLFVASHGLLDENMNYYIATHDINFSNPSEKGLPYEELEALLDGIPARKKLMLIDACHSGEVDKEETEISGTSVGGGLISARAFKSVKKKNVQLGMTNSFELMKELFADLRKGTGAVVISSAGGAEFAFESGQWKNGVFTYSLLEGIKSGKSDLNSDKSITVSELRRYVFERVKELTDGKQNPTTRQDNIEFDFRIW